MEDQFMKPFEIEVAKTFETLMGIRPRRAQTKTKECAESTFEVSAIIGISGGGTGGVVLSFPRNVACKAVSLMIDEECVQLDQDVADGVGELVNIISGNAKRDLVKLGYDGLLLSLPHVVIGRHRTVWRSKDMPCRITWFEADGLGEFCIEVNIRR